MIEIQNLSKTFPTSDGTVEALKNITLTIPDGEIYGIIGMSGAGKSTLVRSINLLEHPTEGRILIDGTDLTQLSEPELRAAELLELVGLGDKRKAYPSQLSGGQQQRVAIARALATHPKILLCDEATSALDPQTTQSILSLIRDIHDKLGITVIVITHQMSVVEQICTRVAILDNGEVAEEGEVSKVFTSPRSKAAKRLVYPDGYELSVAHFDEGGVLRVVFNGAKATMAPMIAQMAIDCGIAASILTASTKSIGDKAYGNMILGIPGGAEAMRRATQYLKAIPDILVEEVENHAE